MERHPDLETLATFAAGKLARRDQPAVVEHLDTCPDCREQVAVASEALREENGEDVQRPAMRWWLAAAAALVAVAVGAMLLVWRRDPMSRLTSLAPRNIRLVEPRLSGGFDWAPYRGPMRAGGVRDPQLLRLAGAAGDLTDRADRHPTADAQQAAGVAMLLIGDPAASMVRLRDAAEKEPEHARAWNDLAAAQFDGAVKEARPSLLPEALGSVDRALRIDPNLAEARFNRALILERLGLVQQATQAWNDYLRLDATSPWAAEARRRLERLPRQTGDSLFRRDLPELERAVSAGDGNAVRRFVARYPQQSRAWGEAEWLGQWGHSVAARDERGAAHFLALARAAGEALSTTTSESLLRDSVQAIERADAGTHTMLAQAHAAYRAARIAYSRGEPKPARPRLLDASRAFAAASSPMTFIARHYAAAALYDNGQSAAAREELEALLAILPPRYLATAAFARWELGLCLMTDGDWSGARPLLEQSERGFATLGERANAAFVQTLLADTAAALGRPDESWLARIRSFETLSAAGYADRLPVSIGAAARMELRNGRLEAARALLRLEEAACRETGNDALVADVLARQALLAARAGEGDAATFARDAASVAARVPDPELRARVSADADLASAAAVLPHDARQARTLLTRAIEAYRDRALPFHLPEPHLLRSRAERLLGDGAAAARDLEEGIAAMERHPVSIAGALSGTGVLDAHAALFEEAIALALDRGDVAGAFAYAERRRIDVMRTAPEVADAGEIARRLANSDTAVLELVALPGELVAFCVTANGLTATRIAVARADLDRLVRANASERLYDLLVRPSDASLRAARKVVIVADKRLAAVPFAALLDARTKQFLIDRFAVALADSASTLQAGAPLGPSPKVLAVALAPADAAQLPESVAEVKDLHGLYRTADLLGAETTYQAFADAARSAQVLHVAGHTERQQGGDDRALVFGGRRVTWTAIAGTPLARAPVVVLAACESLRAPAVADARTGSLGDGFLAAGARAVIGTLEPIRDADARELFLDVHRQLASGVDSAEAVRRVQRRAAARGESDGWRALAVLTNRIPI